MSPTTQSTAATNPLKSLADHGQSVWLDYIRRNLITSGELARLVEDARKLKLGSINLGGSPPDASGLIWFKERFGANIYRYPVFVSQAPWYRMYRTFKT